MRIAMAFLLALFAIAAFADPPETTEELVIACALPCEEALPQSADDLPLCSDYGLDDLLHEAADGGDPSAVAQLERRFDQEVSLFERHRIAMFLLRRVPDDRRYWNALEPFANDAVRFASPEHQPSTMLIEWCERHGVDPSMYLTTTLDAFMFAGTDPRSRSLLQRALATDDWIVISTAIVAAAEQHDESLLPEIRNALARVPDHADLLAMSLASFHSNAADEIASSVLDEAGRKQYAEARDQP